MLTVKQRSPNDTFHKQWSCHNGFDKMRCKLCRYGYIALSNGCPVYRFWASRPCGSGVWHSLLLIKVYQETEQMTRWDLVAKLAVWPDMMKLTLSEKQHPARFSRGYGSYRMIPFLKAPPQCFNCQTVGHMARTCWKESKTCRYCAGSHPSSQCKQDGKPKCPNCGEGHATTSRACSRMVAAIKKSKAP